MNRARSKSPRLPRNIQAAMSLIEPNYTILKFDFTRPSSPIHPTPDFNDTGILLVQTIHPTAVALQTGTYYIPTHISSQKIKVTQMTYPQISERLLLPKNFEVLCHETNHRATLQALDKPAFDKWIAVQKPVYDEAAILNLPNTNPIKHSFHLEDFGTFAHAVATNFKSNTVIDAEETDGKEFFWMPLEMARGLGDKVRMLDSDYVFLKV